MKVMKYCFAAVAALVMLASCDQIIGGDGELMIDPVEDALLEQTVGSTALAAEGVTFTTTGAWTSQVVPSTKGSQPMWVSISPDHGEEAGTYTITISLEANDTGEDRKAYIIITCGEQKITISITQVATEDVPSNGGEEDNSKPQPKCVNSIDYRYTNTVYEYDSMHYTLTYKYDDQNRVVRIEEICDDEDEWDSYEIWHTFDYTIVDNVTVASTYKSGGDYSTRDKTYDVTLQNGRAVQALLKGKYEEYETYKHRFSYDNAGYLVEMATHINEYGQEVVECVELIYSEGLMVGTSWGEEDDDKNLFDANAYYMNRYPNDRTNVDFNIFLLNGDPELEGDICSMLVSLRMCGKFGDACVEVGGGELSYDSPIEQDEFVSDPNYLEHVTYSSTRINEGVRYAVYKFDVDGCPMMISYDDVYDVINIEYDRVADTSESFPFNPMRPKPEVGENGDEVWYRVTTRNYKETKTGEIKCPAVYTITYKE